MNKIVLITIISAGIYFLLKWIIKKVIGKMIGKG